MTREEAIAYGKRVIDLGLNDETQAFCELAIKALEQDPEPVYFPPCVDCQNRSKEIIIAYENMKKMQTFTKEEVITMLDKIRADIEDWQTDIHDNEYDAEKYDFVFEPIYEIIDKYKAESEDKE